MDIKLNNRKMSEDVLYFINPNNTSFMNHDCFNQSFYFPAVEVDSSIANTLPNQTV